MEILDKRKDRFRVHFVLITVITWLKIAERPWTCKKFSAMSLSICALELWINVIEKKQKVCNKTSFINSFSQKKKNYHERWVEDDSPYLSIRINKILNIIKIFKKNNIHEKTNLKKKKILENSPFIQEYFRQIIKIKNKKKSSLVQIS